MSAFLTLVSLWCWHNEGKNWARTTDSFPVTPLLVSHSPEIVTSLLHHCYPIVTPLLHHCYITTIHRVGSILRIRVKSQDWANRPQFNSSATSGPFVNLFSWTVGALGHENYFIRTPTFFTRTFVRHGTLRLSSDHADFDLSIFSLVIWTFSTIRCYLLHPTQFSIHPSHPSHKSTAMLLYMRL